MFQSLRVNGQFFILHKDNVPYVETGTVVSVSAPMPKYPAQMPPFGQPQEMTVDIVVRTKDGNVTFQKLPANGDVADFGVTGQMFLATSKEAINAELSALRQKSYDIVNSRDYHLSVIDGCDKAYKDLNPEYAEKQQQTEELNMLKAQMATMTQNFNELIAMNKELMSQMADVNASKKVAASKKD